jgi:ferritin heavy chain
LIPHHLAGPPRAGFCCRPRSPPPATPPTLPTPPPPPNPKTTKNSIEYTVSYVYHALHAYFDRDNVQLPGFAKFFKEASDEERDHAQKLIAYQNERGGRVRLAPLAAPETEFTHAEKGDALYAMELALAMEKLNFHKLRELHGACDKAGDAAAADFVEGELLAEQTESVRKVAGMVAQLRRVGPGLGVFEFDRTLQ